MEILWLLLIVYCSPEMRQSRPKATAKSPKPTSREGSGRPKQSPAPPLPPKKKPNRPAPKKDPQILALLQELLARSERTEQSVRVILGLLQGGGNVGLVGDVGPIQPIGSIVRVESVGTQTTAGKKRRNKKEEEEEEEGSEAEEEEEEEEEGSEEGEDEEGEDEDEEADEDDEEYEDEFEESKEEDCEPPPKSPRIRLLPPESPAGGQPKSSR